jgi:ribosomal protein L40E
MVICEQCGAANQSGESFCGTCGSYLEWEEHPPDPAGLPSPTPVSRAEPEPPSGADDAASRRTLLDRVKAATGIEPSPLDHGTAGPPGQPAPPLTPQSPPVKNASAAPSPGPSDVPDQTTMPKPPLTSATPPPTHRAAAPVRPGAGPLRPRRRELPVEDRRPLPGESVCPDCGAGNAATRRFCRRCGADLVDAPTVPALPWYRRILRRTPRPAPVAGARPGVRPAHRGRRRALRLLAVVAALLAVGWFARPYVGLVADLARDRMSNEIVRPSGFAASSAARGHPAKAVGDGAPNQYWSPATTGAATGQFVTLTLPSPIRLAYVNIYNGPTSQKGKAYQATARVGTLKLTMTRVDGGVETQTIPLRDTPGEQHFHVGASDVVSVRLTVMTAYGAGPDQRIALGEVELFKRS